eukprot:365661-Chlamydomonas_euryale.AAC.50
MGGLYKGVMSPLAGQMFFRASLFGAFGESKRWLGTNADGSSRTLQPLDFYKAGAMTGEHSAHIAPRQGSLHEHGSSGCRSVPADMHERACPRLVYFCPGFVAAFSEGPIDFYKSQIQVQIIKSKMDPAYKREWRLTNMRTINK